VLLDVLVEGVGDVLIDKVQCKVLLVDLQQLDQIETVDQLPLDLHLVLFLQQLLQRQECLNVLYLHRTTTRRPLFEGVDIVLNL
jgi:hypothetical protein